MAELPKVGGTKNPERDAIVQLAPDLVIANREENTRRDVEALERAGLMVWVTYPRTVREGAQLLGDLAGLGAAPEAVASVVEPVLESVRGAEQAPPGEPRASIQIPSCSNSRPRDNAIRPCTMKTRDCSRPYFHTPRTVYYGIQSPGGAPHACSNGPVRRTQTSG